MPRAGATSDRCSGGAAAQDRTSEPAYDFIARNPDFRHLVSYADTHRFNWLDFSLDEAAKLALFAEGAKAAADFVAKFDWAGYKEVRCQLLKAYQVTAAIAPSADIS
jgi:NTE family protein